jgi:hypothetical protein
MVRLFIRHNVADYETWRQVYDELDGRRRTMGVTAEAVYQSIDDPNDVTVWHDFETAQAAQAFASSPEQPDAMERGGVQGEPQTWLVGTEAQRVGGGVAYSEGASD